MSFKAQLKAKREAEAAQPKASRKRSVPKDYVPPPPIDEFDLPLKAVRQIDELMQQHHDITKQQSELNADKAALTEEIRKLCKLYTLEFFSLGQLQAKVYPVRREKIDKGLLLAAGISPITIIKCTRVTTSESLKISEVGQQEREGEEYEP